MKDKGGHTPGPWEVGAPDENGEIAVVASGGYLVTYAFPNGDDCREANARLIASAPELLAQLEFAVKLLSGFPTLSGTAQIGAMRDVIAKAKGQVTLTEYAAISKATGASK